LFKVGNLSLPAAHCVVLRARWWPYICLPAGDSSIKMMITYSTAAYVPHDVFLDIILIAEKQAIIFLLINVA
jgi:hypothetical protein